MESKRIGYLLLLTVAVLMILSVLQLRGIEQILSAHSEHAARHSSIEAVDGLLEATEEAIAKWTEMRDSPDKTKVDPILIWVDSITDLEEAVQRVKEERR